MLSGDNSILQRGTEASTQTTHKAVYEGIQLEYLGYLTDKKAGKTTQSFVEYLQGKSIIQSEYQEGTGKYQINVQNLIGASKYGKGNASNGLVDVYMLEKQETITGRIESIKIATTTPIKIATTSSNETYKVVYYGAEGESSRVEIGSITDTNTSSGIDNSAAVIAYFNADGNYNEETWGTNGGINPEELTYIIGVSNGLPSYHDEENDIYYDYDYFKYTDGKVYKVTNYWDDVNGKRIATAAEPVESNINLAVKGVYQLDGKNVLVLPDNDGGKVFHHRSFDGYVYQDTNEPFTSGYCDVFNYHFYDDSGNLVNVSNAGLN